MSSPRLFFRKSFSTLGSPDLDWLQTLEFAQKNRFDGIEIRILQGEVLNPDNVEFLLPKPDRLVEELRLRGLRVPMLGTSVKLLDRTDRELEDLRCWAVLADQLNCPWLRIFDGGHATAPLAEETLATTSDFLNDWENLRRREGFQCQLAVETHDAFASLKQVRAALDQLPMFRLLWDTHHTWRFGEALAAYHQTVREHTVHYHVKDSVNRPSKRKPFTYVAPGHGEFPWAELRAILSEEPARGFLSFEWEKHWHPDLAPISEVTEDFHAMTQGW